MKMIKLKPAIPGNIVRDPVTKQPLAADGEEKNRSSYWLRCLARGDVVLVVDGATAEQSTDSKE